MPNLQLFAAYRIPVILYDQLGNGRSTHLPDKPASFWTVDVFMDQLDSVLTHFGIGCSFDLLGHSWGGMLASQYAAIRRPPGLKRLVLANAPASMELWMESTRKLGDRLPNGLGDVLRQHEEAEETETPQYRRANLEFMKRYICQIYPFPSELSESFKQMDLDSTVYNALYVNVNHFVLISTYAEHRMGSIGGVYVTGGNLEKWSIVESMHHITQPTLLLNGADDEFQDSSLQPFFEKIPNVKWYQFSKSHIPFLEELDRYLQIVGSFLAQEL
ncbi:hypothetical protein VNI00_006904 [Paramarasmius palmivorus]|uniref:AB hydrolase-1 domain-containing protein n=1 Tax=Paramarasmius palmivorus TaxID=297713 RepID=A0AAW0D4U5_9AGAR